MKLYIILGIIISLSLITKTYTLSVNHKRTTPNQPVVSKEANLKLDEINNVLNLGWNAFGQNEDYIKDPIRLLTTGKIFDMKIDIKTKSYDRLFFSAAPYESSVRTTYNYVNEPMLKFLYSHSVLGTYTISNNSTAQYLDANSFVKKDVKSAVTESNNYMTLELSHNHLTQFPTLKKEFYEEAYNTFYKLTNGESFFNVKEKNFNHEAFTAIVKFLNNYGTHYVNKAFYGYRSGFRNSFDANSDPKQNELNVKDFTIGKCKVADKKLIKDSCDINDPYLIKIEVSPISDLFNPVFQSSPDVNQYQGKVLDEKTVRKMFENIRNSVELIQEAIRIDNLALTSFELSTLESKNPSSPCFNQETRKKVYDGYLKNFQNFLKKHQLNRQLKIVNMETPVPVLYNYSKVQDSLASAVKGSQGLFACQKKNYLLPVTAEMTKLKQVFITDLRFVGDNDVKTFTEVGYKCRKAWNFKDPKGSSDIDFHLCRTETNNPFDDSIITDIKYFEFQKNSFKCSDRTLNVYNDNFAYSCDCNLDYSLLSDNKSQGDTFMCISRIRENLEESVKPPQVKFRRVKHILPKELTEMKSREKSLENMAKGIKTEAKATPTSEDDENNMS